MTPKERAARNIYDQVLVELDRCPDFGMLSVEDFRADMIERVQYLRDRPDAILAQEDT